MNETSTAPAIIEVDRKLACALFYIDGFLIAIFNLLTFLVFATNRQLRRRSFYLVISLTFADFLLGVAVITRTAFNIVSYKKEFNQGKVLPEQKALHLCDILTSGTSYMGLILIAVERAYATVFPFSHRNLKNTTYGIAIAFHWLFLGPFLSICYNVFSIRRYYSTVGIVVLTGLVIIVVSYISIFIKVKLQNSQLRQHGGHNNLARHQERERELAKTLFIVTAISILTWLPIAIRSALNSSSFMFFLIEQLFRFSNSLVNPVVYVFRIREFRQALYELVFKCARRVRSQEGVSSERKEGSSNTGRTMRTESTENL